MLFLIKLVKRTSNKTINLQYSITLLTSRVLEWSTIRISTFDLVGWFPFRWAPTLFTPQRLLLTGMSSKAYTGFLKIGESSALKIEQRPYCIPCNKLAFKFKYELFFWNCNMCYFSTTVGTTVLRSVLL